jgi:hypothetical protein
LLIDWNRKFHRHRDIGRQCIERKGDVGSHPWLFGAESDATSNTSELLSYFAVSQMLQVIAGNRE